MNRRTFLAASASSAALGFSPSLRSADNPLAEHRIDRIETAKISVPWPRLVGRNAVKDVHGRGPTNLPAVVLHTDQGATGWGQVRGTWQTVDADYIETLQGKTIAELIDPTIGVLGDEWLPVDVALHDLVGVILNQPVWQLMSGKEKPELTKVYSGMIYFDDLDPKENPAGIDQVLKNCAWDYDFGYRQFKVKIGRGNRWMKPPEAGLRRDIEVVKAIHEAFPDVEILVDGNNGFTVDAMIQFCEGIGDVPLFWIEEPFHETVADWTRLNDWLDANGRKSTLCADGEAKPDAEVLETLQENGVLDVRLEDTFGLGFTPWRKWLPQLAKAGVQASPHAWGSATKTLYTAHLLSAYGNAPTLEGVSTQGGNIDFGENQIVDGKYQPSSRPGFGVMLEKG